MCTRRARQGIAFATLALLCGCGSSNSVTETGSPTQPSPTTLTAISIIGPDSLEIGSTATLRAAATYSDNTTHDVTTTASWASTTPSICMVSETGTLTALGAGACEPSATLSGVIAHTSIEVRPAAVPAPTFVVSGFVHETPPTEHVPVAGALIEVLEGTLAGRRFTTDTGGRFALPPVTAAGFRLHVSRDGFANEFYHVRAFPKDATVDVALMPEPAERTVVFSGSDPCTLPPSAFRSSGVPYGEARIIGDFAVHNTGDVTLPLGGSMIPAPEYTLMFLQRRLSSGQVERRKFPGDRYWWSVPLPVEGGYIYSVEIYYPLANCEFSAPDHFWRRGWRLTVRHPS